MPRERFDTSVRRRIGNYLAGVYGGRVSAFHPFFPEGPLVRVHFIIGLPEDHIDPSSSGRSRGSCTWIDELGERLERVHEPGKARRLLERYREAFSQGYRESFSPRLRPPTFA